MCDELLEILPNYPEVISVNANRPVSWNDSSGHLLTTDLIYCLGVYGLTIGMTQPLSKAKRTVKRQQTEREALFSQTQQEIDELQALANRYANATGNANQAKPYYKSNSELLKLNTTIRNNKSRIRQYNATAPQTGIKPENGALYDGVK